MVNWQYLARMAAAWTSHQYINLQQYLVESRQMYTVSIVACKYQNQEVSGYVTNMFFQK